MGIAVWHKKKSKSLRLGQDYAKTDPENHLFQKLWRKIKGRERTKKGHSGSPVVSDIKVSYDPDNYMKNFDEGPKWAEPDHFYRSFSARFADPSRRFSSRNIVVDFVKK